jgi:hypothetical protein
VPRYGTDGDPKNGSSLTLLAPGRRPPSESDLNIAARQTLKSSEFANGSQEDQEKYMDGFKSGYESGFREAAKPAF